MIRVERSYWKMKTEIGLKKELYYFYLENPKY